MDQIIIENLKVYAYHGVFEEEQEQGQDFYINAILDTDLRKAGQTDELTYSTHYGMVCDFMVEFMNRRKYQLIESVAEQMAEAVLLEFPLLYGITLEIRKPHAPIAHPFESVSVKISRSWHKVYLSFGSNIGNRLGYLNAAISKLKADTHFRKLRVSDYIETEPYGGVEQEKFLNGALEIETLYAPLELLQTLQTIEKEEGRTREIHWGPRTLDLDILFYDDLIMDCDVLTIPHPDMKNRHFVLEPMASIAPYYVHPVYRKTMRDLLGELD